MVSAVVALFAVLHFFNYSPLEPGLACCGATTSVFSKVGSALFSLVKASFCTSQLRGGLSGVHLAARCTSRIPTPTSLRNPPPPISFSFMLLGISYVATCLFPDFLDCLELLLDSLLERLER